MQGDATRKQGAGTGRGPCGLRALSSILAHGVQRSGLCVSLTSLSSPVIQSDTHLGVAVECLGVWMTSAIS